MEIDWKGFDASYSRKKTDLPTYPFQRQRYGVKALNPISKEIVNDLLPKEEVYVEKTLLEEQLAKLLPGERRMHIQKFLNEKLCFILGMPPDSVLPEDKGFFDLGMDSLMAVEFKNQLQSALGKAYPLPETLAFDYPNLALLGEYLQNLLEHKILEKAATVQMTYLAEPIAIIGLGCRFPGGARDPESFWKFLLEGKDGICEAPPGRFECEKAMCLLKQASLMRSINLMQSFLGSVPAKLKAWILSIAWS